MTANRNWREEGLGETGQAYIVGADGALRSDLRQEIERPEQFYSGLREAGIDTSLLTSIQANRTAVLNLKMPGFPPARPEPYTGQATNLRGIPVLRSSAPLAVPGLDWTLVAEIDAAEAFAPVVALRNRIFGYGILIAAVFFLAATALARTVTEPVLQLTRSALQMAARDFSARTTVHSGDELGQLASAFNRMAEDLEKTTVSKQEVDRILSSLINAVFVVEVELGATVDDLLASPIREANPAASRLLGFPPGTLRGLAFGKLLPQPAWRPLLAALHRERHLETVEAELLRADGASVPVFFTAAYLSAQPNRPAGVVCAAQDITEYRNTTIALKQKQQELELLAGRLIKAQEEERTRVARELHDDLTQRLAAVAIEAGRLQNLTSSGPPAWREGLENIKQQMARLSTDVHGLSRRLHPSSLDDLGLVAALESECRSFFERGGPPVDLQVKDLPPALDKDVELALYRIAQEALRNVAKHAHAAQVWLTLEGAGNEVIMTIRDDGTGFERSHPRHGPGLGLASMEERTRLLGGVFSLASAPGRGTSLQVKMPVAKTK
jgi:PAS domain S-box-containing protein